jgi:hypothetical protein
LPSFRGCRWRSVGGGGGVEDFGFGAPALDFHLELGVDVDGHGEAEASVGGGAELFGFVPELFADVTAIADDGVEIEGTGGLEWAVGANIGIAGRRPSQNAKAPRRRFLPRSFGKLRYF